MPIHFRGPAAQVRALDAFVKLSRASLTLGSRLAGPMQRGHGLTEGQLGVLEVLLHRGPMPQRDLCTRLLVGASNMTTVLDNLERRGWVRRQTHPDDRRVQVVHLTPGGRRVIVPAFRAHAANITALLGVLRIEEQRQLGRLCRKLGTGAAGVVLPGETRRQGDTP